MHAETHHVRSFLIAVLLALLVLIMSARPVQSAWGVEPVQVHATVALCLLVSACDDAGYGANITRPGNSRAG